MPKFIMVTHPDSYDVGVQHFSTLKEALETFQEYVGYGANPILTQILDVDSTVADISGNRITKPLHLTEED